MNFDDRMCDLLGRLLGRTINNYQFDFAASWARNNLAWLFFGCLGLTALATTFYLRYQRTRRPGARVALIVLRAASLCLMLLLLAEPVLRTEEKSTKRPLLWLLLDGTDSMAITDDLPSAERAAADQATGNTEATPSRTDYLKALLENQDQKLLEKLSEKYRLQAFIFDGPQGVRSLELNKPGRQGIDVKHLAGQLTNTGKVTALGTAFEDLAQRHASGNVGAVVVFSDFVWNSGPPPVPAARRLGVPVCTVGIGATSAADASVDIKANPSVKKGERAAVNVTVRQQGLDGQKLHVTVTAEPLGVAAGAAGGKTQIGEQTVTMTGSSQNIEFPYVPDKAGRFSLVAEVDPLSSEVVRENNRKSREITVLDDYLRLLYVEYEPTWEWRFIKEVFHRDKLVGMQGFRTFLHASDPRVRQSNALFLPTMTPPRNEFFAYDVIFLGDMPSANISQRFCEMVQEFVHDFGGGLVVLAGPRFGIGQLAGTPLADMLPVTIEPNAAIDDRKPFALNLTPMASQYDFMKLGDSTEENQKAWDNLGLLPWFQPVRKADAMATVLAEHPSQNGPDGKTREPLVAIRRYGRGEVIYIGFNETWRLRRKYSERYYRKFWGELMQRLAFSHALGNQKRFVVRTDRDPPQYLADEEVVLTIEAYNADFKPLTDNSPELPEHKLLGQLQLPVKKGESPKSHPLTISQLSPGVFETRFRVFAQGEHRIQVTDPVPDKNDPTAKKTVEYALQVTANPVERQRAVRSTEVQQAIAAQTRGKTFGLANFADLAEIQLDSKTEIIKETIPLANTWVCFGLVVALLVAEWGLRKWVNLA